MIEIQLRAWMNDEWQVLFEAQGNTYTVRINAVDQVLSRMINEEIMFAKASVTISIAYN